MATKLVGKKDTEAADWFVALNSECDISEDQFDEFAKWIESPGAEDAFGRTESVWELTAMLKNDPVIESHRQEARQAKRSFWKNRKASAKVYLAAACILIVGFVGLHIANNSVPVETSQIFVYQTMTGERKTVTLPDASVVTLNTASEIHVDYGSQYRRVILERGEALFEVSQNKQRPFKVVAGSGEITALGTVFDVRLYDNSSKHVSVALIEGKISVEKVLPQAGSDKTARKNAFPKKLLSTGEQIVFDDSRMSDITLIDDIENVVSWKSGHLYFTDKTLSEIVAEVNRYTVSKLAINDTGLGKERITAFFDLSEGDYDTLLFALEENLGIKWYNKSGTTVLYKDSSQLEE